MKADDTTLTNVEFTSFACLSKSWFSIRSFSQFIFMIDFKTCKMVFYLWAWIKLIGSTACNLFSPLTIVVNKLIRWLVRATKEVGVVSISRKVLRCRVHALDCTEDCVHDAAHGKGDFRRSALLPPVVAWLCVKRHTFVPLSCIGFQVFDIRVDFGSILSVPCKMPCCRLCAPITSIRFWF